jgi:hypothetical protein
MKKTKKKHKMYFNPEDPKKSFNVYYNKNPDDTIPIKFATLYDVKNTIIKLERLYKQKKYQHDRIFKVAMIMQVRLRVIYNRFKKGFDRYRLATRYLNFLNKRTTLTTENRFTLSFKFYIKKSKDKSKDKRKILLEKCGIPDTKETSHCFNDTTHHTCCHLGKDAREYAGKSGNPIGKVSERMFKIKNKRPPNPNEKTPWCTCFGSSVCGYYADRFDDGTKIKFINNPRKNQVAINIPNKNCEKYTRNFMSVSTHGTPGVVSKNGGECHEKDQIKFVDIHY